MTLLGTRTLAGVAAAALTISLTACSGGSDSVAGERTPEEMIAAAQKELGAAQTVKMVLETQDLPKGLDGLVKASGTATKTPAFEGKITVMFSGFNAEVPVRALDGKVWAIVPGSTDWAEIDPAQYGAPDPATLIDESSGFGGLLGRIDGLKHVEDALVDGEKVATYAGTVSGADMKKVMPSSDDSQPFTGEINLDEDGELLSMSLTGLFYEGKPSLTYSLTFTDYSDDLTPVQAPTT